MADSIIDQYDYVGAEPEKLRLRNDNVIVELLTAPTQTKSGIYIPTPDAGLNGAVGIVRKVGPGPAHTKKCDKCSTPLQPCQMSVQEGDKVILEHKTRLRFWRWWRSVPPPLNPRLDSGLCVRGIRRAGLG